MLPPMGLAGSDMRLAHASYRLHAEHTYWGLVCLPVCLMAGLAGTAWAWHALTRIWEKQVMGRMLNTITGGYAVGVGGIVAFLPFSSCSLVSAGRIGALQVRRADAAMTQPPHATSSWRCQLRCLCIVHPICCWGG